MECEENGEKCWSPARAARGIKRKRRTDDARHLYLPVSDPVLGPSVSQSMHNDHFQPRRFEATTAICHPPTSDPFMNNMEEISYWVYTKRAPCLYDYDKLVKKQSKEAHTSREVSGLTFPVENEVPSPKKKKKNILDDDSYLSEKQQNVFFETPLQQNHKKVNNNCKSISPGPNIEINIKNTSTPRVKKPKLQRNYKNNLTRRKKIVTSTPKVQHQNLRRSLRLQQSINNSGQFDSSFEIINESTVNGIKKVQEKQREDKEVKAVIEGNRSKKEIFKNKPKNNAHNGEFEDYSDVSGFTANYIRSTKLNKTPRKVRRKNNRNLMQESRQNVDPEGSKMIVCVNKSMNTGDPTSAVLNHSTDSSQNVINLITVASNDKSTNVNQSTSLLKFVDKNVCKKSNGHFLNDSFQSGSSAASRYPKRINNMQSKNKSQNLNERKENSPEKFVYRTRSRKRLIEESGEQVNSNEESSNAIVNVGSPELRKKNARCIEDPAHTGHLVDSLAENQKNNDNNPLQKCVRRVKKSLDKRQSLKKDSLRDKSGFAACFSDSDSDVEPLKSRKFFC